MHLRLGLYDRFADLQGDPFGEFGCACAQDGGNPPQQGAAFSARRARPAALGLIGAGKRRIDLGIAVRLEAG